MAQYQARQRELQDRYTALIGKIPFEEVNRILTALTEHARLRDEALVALGNIAADPDDKPRHEDFTARLDERRKAVVGVLEDMFRDVKELSNEGMRFRDQAAYEEERFFKSLKELEPVKARDTQRQLARDLEKLASEMRAKWLQLSDTEKTLLDKERYAALLMRQTFQKVLEELVAQHLAVANAVTAAAGSIDRLKSKVNSDYEEVTKEAMKQTGINEELGTIVTSQFRPGGLVAKGFYAGLSLLNPILGAVAIGAGHVARVIKPTVDSAMRDAVGELRARFFGSIQVAMVFSDTRRQANEYLSKSGYDRAKEHYARSRSALDGWASGQSGALKTEAEAWVKVADTGLCYFLELMRGVHAGLVSQFEGIFMNDLAERTVNALSDRPFFLDWQDGIQRMDFDDKLKNFRAHLVTLSGDLDAAFIRLKTFDHLPRDAQTLLHAQVMEIKDMYEGPVKERMQEALRALDAAQARSARDTTQEMMDLLARQRESLMKPH